MSGALSPASDRVVLDLPGADVSLQQFCDAVAAREWFERLREEVPWERHRLRIFGRDVDAPRLSCWIGNADATYTYSGTRFEAHAWTPACAELRDRVSALCGDDFNSVLCNLYRDGRDSMGWHSDDEPELGVEPVIASLSLGASRTFQLRRKDYRRCQVPWEELSLSAGSLLVMRGSTQRLWQHRLPKQLGRACGARVNLSFRWIEARGT